MLAIHDCSLSLKILIIFAFLILQQRLSTDFGLTVVWDSKQSAQITISPDYWNNTCGLCGTYDDDPNNDFLTPDGIMVSKLYSEILFTVKCCVLPIYHAHYEHLH